MNNTRNGDPVLAQGKGKDIRFKQADREALLALFVYALYFIWWYVSAYGLGGGNPDDYSYVLGMPAWFFYSCIVGYPLITITLWAVVRLFFRDMPLGDIDGDGNPSGGASTTTVPGDGGFSHAGSVADTMPSSHGTCLYASRGVTGCSCSTAAESGEGSDCSVEPGDRTQGGHA